MVYHNRTLTYVFDLMLWTAMMPREGPGQRSVSEQHNYNAELYSLIFKLMQYFFSEKEQSI